MITELTKILHEADKIIEYCQECQNTLLRVCLDLYDLDHELENRTESSEVGKETNE